MKLLIYLMSVSLAVVLLGNPSQALADDGFASAATSGAPAAPRKMPALSTDKATQQPKSSEPLEIASVDYCYAGSMVDPASGEKVDLFVFCTDDAIAGNLDLA
jgi:hypothetical protein